MALAPHECGDPHTSLDDCEPWLQVMHTRCRVGLDGLQPLSPAWALELVFEFISFHYHVREVIGSMYTQSPYTFIVADSGEDGIGPTSPGAIGDVAQLHTTFVVPVGPVPRWWRTTPYPLPGDSEWEEQRHERAELCRVWDASQYQGSHDFFRGWLSEPCACCGQDIDHVPDTDDHEGPPFIL